MRPLIARDLGLVSYGDAIEFMRDLAGRVADGLEPDTLLFASHHPVITLGRKRGARDNVMDAGDMPVVAVERGGDATYHGPGQLMSYPVMLLGAGERDMHLLLRNLEECVIEALARLGVPAGRNPGLTGVWSGDRKIASIGVAARRWVVYHGVALNLSPEPAFAAVRACGLEGDRISNLEALTGRRWHRDDVIPELAAAFGAVFGRAMGGADPRIRPAREAPP